MFLLKLNIGRETVLIFKLNRRSIWSTYDPNQVIFLNLTFTEKNNRIITLWDKTATLTK